MAAAVAVVVWEGRAQQEPWKAWKPGREREGGSDRECGEAGGLETALSWL